MPLHVASPDWAISNEPPFDLPTTKHRYLSSSDDVGVCSSFPIMYFVEPSFHEAKHNSSSTETNGTRSLNGAHKWNSRAQNKRTKKKTEKVRQIRGRAGHLAVWNVYLVSNVRMEFGSDDKSLFTKITIPNEHGYLPMTVGEHVGVEQTSELHQTVRFFKSRSKERGV